MERVWPCLWKGKYLPPIFLETVEKTRLPRKFYWNFSNPLEYVTAEPTRREKTPLILKVDRGCCRNLQNQSFFYVCQIYWTPKLYFFWVVYYVWLASKNSYLLRVGLGRDEKKRGLFWSLLKNREPSSALITDDVTLIDSRDLAKKREINKYLRGRKLRPGPDSLVS